MWLKVVLPPMILRDVTLGDLNLCDLTRRDFRLYDAS